MAITAYSTCVVTNRTVFGNKRVVIGYLTFANDTWPSGGVAFTGADVGIGGIDYMDIGAASLNYYYDYTAGKVNGYLCTVAGNAAAKANGQTIAAETVYFMIIGHGKG
jgi:hypothetical protein